MATAAAQPGQWGTAAITAGSVSGAALIAAQASLSESAAASAPVVSGAPASAATELSIAAPGSVPAAASAASPAGEAGTPPATTAVATGGDGSTPATPTAVSPATLELAGTSAAVEPDGAGSTAPASAAAGSTAPGETAPGTLPGPIAPVPSPGTLTGASVASVSTAATPSTPSAPLASQVARPLFSLAAAGPGEHTLSISVTPDNLGPVLVRAQISASGVRLELFAPTELARDALRQILPDLRRDLAGGGLPASLDLSTRSQPGDAGSNGRYDRPAPDFSAQADSSFGGDAREGASRDPSPDPWLRASPIGPDSADPASHDTNDSAGAGSPRGRVDVLA
ncbi:flagellar hook-length control protein FliK [Cryobacterium arcticum]|uniref:flagellar hook-length control protein FliK n=1 Tax=Cryobacterium arcticum TaxID=670052 RepID=UPI0011B75FAA|nr:flagellar hook-length control protein FliK [Cryobacterium arcticum]